MAEVTGGDAGREGRGAGVDGVFRRAWWAVALRGLLAAAVGLVVLSRPGMALPALVTMLGFYLLFDGVLTLIIALHSGRGQRRWWPYFWEGLLSAVAGVLLLLRPRETALAMIAIVGVRAILTGVIEIASGRSLRSAGGGPAWMLLIAGIGSIAFGILLLSVPATGVTTLVLVAGIYGVVFGASMLAEAFELVTIERSRFASRLR